MIYSQCVNNIYLFLKGSEKLSYLTRTHELSLFPLNNIGKTHSTKSIWGNACLSLACNHPFPSTSLEFQNPHGQVSYYGGRQTGRSVWESCWKNDPPPTRMSFKINKGKKMKELHSATEKVSVGSWFDETPWGVGCGAPIRMRLFVLQLPGSGEVLIWGIVERVWMGS